jgi:hypothetical protein
MVSLNGAMAVGAGGGGATLGLQSPPSGWIRLVKSNRTPKQDWECNPKTHRTSGELKCEFVYDIGLRDAEATILLVHIVTNRYSYGFDCEGSTCECGLPEKVQHVEFMHIDKARTGFREELSRKVYGCGCYISMVGSLFLGSSKSKPFQRVMEKVEERRRRITRGVFPNYEIPPGAIGNREVIRTGKWQSSYFTPSDLTDLLTDLLDSAEAQVVHKCETSWNCCPDGQKRPIPSFDASSTIPMPGIPAPEPKVVQALPQSASSENKGGASCGCDA